MGARVAVGTGCALLAACLAGTPLLISASASGAAQLQIAQTCPSDVALTLGFSGDEGQAFLDGHVDDVSFDAVQRISKSAFGITISGLADDIDRGAILLNIDGQETNVRPPLAALGANEIAASRDVLGRLGAAVGDRVTLSGESQRSVDEQGNVVVSSNAPRTTTVTIAAAFDEIPYQPAPSFWCGHATLFSPGRTGDPPRNAMILAAPELIESFNWSGTWEVRLPDEPMTRRQVEGARDSFTDVTNRYAEYLQISPDEFRLSGEPDPVATIVTRAESLASAVQKAIAPVRIVGVLTALLVLMAAAVMLARERRRELRLLALRGLSPWRGGVRLLGLVVVPVMVGTVAGLVLAVIGIQALGPTSKLEPDQVRVAVTWVIVGALVATAVEAGITTFVGDRFVDSRPRRHRWRWVPFELPVVIAAVLSARSLSESGGMKMFGVEARGGQLLAQAFPQLAIATGVVLLARPLLLLVRRLRVVGARLPRGLRLGVRRVVMEAAVTTTMVAAVALASGSFVLAGILSASADQQLVDKASLYIGSDLAIVTNGPAEVPPGIADRATAVQRVDASFEGESIDVLSIDPDTFAQAVIWRDDAASTSLDELIDAIRWTEGRARPAIFVGDDAPGVGEALVIGTGASDRELSFEGVAVAEFFPGYKQGTVMAVVDRASLASDEVGANNAIWVRGPPADAVEQVLARGGRVRTTQRVEDVFDVVSYSAQRWSYIALSAFGILVACTVITLQMLVVEARRGTRRLSHLMLSRMGFSSRSLWVASLIEVGVPLLGGATIGALFARLAAGWSVRRLDPLPGLKPSSVVVTPVSSIMIAGIAALVTAIVLAAITVWSTTRGDPMEVSRETA